MRYFPNWKCWLASFILLLISIVPVYILDKIVRAILTSEFRPPSVYSVGAIFSLILFLFLVFPIFLYAHIWEFLFGERDYGSHFLIPNPRSIAEGLWAWLVLIICTGFTIDILHLFFGKLPVNLTSRQESFAGLTMFTLVAYAYHLRLKFIKAPPEKKINPIEQELNGIKEEMGIKKMNDVNKRD